MRKWKSCVEATLGNVPTDLRDNMDKEITEDERFTMVLGIEWNSRLDAF